MRACSPFFVDERLRRNEVSSVYSAVAGEIHISHFVCIIMCYNEFMVTTPTVVHWEGEEYIEQKRNFWWFFGLAVVTLALAALSIFLQVWTFLILIVLAAVTILVRALMPPRKIKYTLDKNGLTEGNQKHPFSEFRAFGIMQEGGHYSAVLIPKKRLGMQVKVYFPETNGEAIVDMLGMRLPMEEIRLDFIDKIIKFLRIS